MKAIFKDRSYDSCLLEVNGGETSVEFVVSDTERDEEIFVTLDKKECCWTYSSFSRMFE